MLMFNQAHTQGIIEIGNIVAEEKQTMVNTLNVRLPEASQYVRSRRFVKCVQSTRSKQEHQTLYHR